MNKLPITVLLAVLLISAPVTVFAGLKVITAKESDLPFELPPSKFYNSPSQFSHSPSRFYNSPSKFDNSPLQFENGKSGYRRLLLEQEGSYFYIGC